MTWLTNQLPMYVSWRPDPEVEGTDAFFQAWSQVGGYAFPLFSLVGVWLSQVCEQDTQHVSCSLSMGDTVLVPSTVTSGCRLSMPLPNRPMASLQGGVTSPSPPTSTSRVTGLRQCYTSMGISNQAKGLLVSAW